jgi:TRAP-type mannitol/chloroaromatic compound transport system permease large subunit
VRGGLRYFGGVLAFGFAAMWIMASLAAALVCLSAAVVGYGGISVAELMRARSARRAKSSSLAASRGTPVLTGQTPEAIPLWADALNSDLGHIYEPGATTSPLSREAEYGWPRDEDTVLTSAPLH